MTNWCKLCNGTAHTAVQYFNMTDNSVVRWLIERSDGIKGTRETKGTKILNDCFQSITF
jgi:hypothetical protein